MGKKKGEKTVQGCRNGSQHYKLLERMKMREGERMWREGMEWSGSGTGDKKKK